MMFTKADLQKKSEEVVASATFLFGRTREELKGNLSLDAIGEVSPYIEVAISGYKIYCTFGPSDWERTPKKLQDLLLASNPGLTPEQFHTSHCIWEKDQLETMCRGSKKYFASSLDFWIKSLNQISVDLNYDVHMVEPSLCQPVSEDEFESFVATQTELIKRLFNDKPRGQFVAALHMRSAWNKFAVISETTEEFIAYFWCNCS